MYTWKESSLSLQPPTYIVHTQLKLIKETYQGGLQQEGLCI